MYLKAIEIHGFKSFGEKVNIEFTKGITSIIGPNGSGKSNILDAVLWVLGEQSNKNIRAKESSDVIFSGGKDIKPMNFAEVSLIMDNADRYFPMDSDTIKITRKLSLKKDSLENDYFINERKARLKDIANMFLDTGIGKTAYSVIGQGRVERIINSTPREVKGIIEEAAGVKKFQQDKATASKRLAEFDLDLEKLDIEIRNSKENRDKYEKQADKAIKFVEIRDERDSYAKAIYLADYNDRQNKLATNTELQEKFKKAVDENSGKLKEIVRRIEEVDTEKLDISNKISDLDQKNKDLNDEIAEKNRDKSIQEERIVRYQENITHFNGNIASNEKRIIEKDEQIKKLEEEKEILDKEIEKLAVENELMLKNLEESQKIRDEKQADLDAKTRQIGQLEISKATYQNEVVADNRRYNDSKNRISNLKKELKAWEEDIDDVKKSIDAKKIDLTTKETFLVEKENRRDFLSSASGDTSKKLNDVIRRLTEITGQYDINKNRLNQLIRDDESNEGYQRGVREILNSNLDGIEGTFISLVSIPEKYEVAIMAGAGGNMQDIVVPTSNVVKKAIDLLNERKVGKASFLALDTIKVYPRKEMNINISGIVGLASTLVKSDPRYEKIVEFVLGNMLIVENLDVGLEVIKKGLFSGSVVTLSGELLSARGRITGGVTQSKSKANDILERKREIKILEEKVQELKDELKNLEISKVKYSEEIENIENELFDLEGILEKERSDFDTLEKELDKLKARKEELDRNGNTIIAELNNEEKYSNEYEKNIGKSRSEWENIEDQLAVMRVDLQEVEKEVIELGNALRKKQELHSDVRINFENKKARRSQIDNDIKNYFDERESYVTDNNGTKNNITMTFDYIEECKVRIQELTTDIENLEKKYDSENDDINQLKKSLEDLNIEEKALNDSRLKTQEEFQSKEYALQQAENQIEKNKHDLEELNEKLLPLEEIIPRTIDVNHLKEEKENFKKLDIKVKSFGDVSVAAIEEYKTAKEKYDVLSTQKDDLVNSKAKLMEIISEVDDKIRENFYKAYNDIDANFNIMCEATLNNSEGKLALINPENFDECGVEIWVKFKNKKRQSLSLLSGGEKSMVAIAFVISIFMYKPSPFTFLDEIEAALDETNTTKLLNRLREINEKSQFILITHNKVTMSKSDTILGVSMNKDIGVTKILGVNVVSLDEYLKRNKGIEKPKEVMKSK
ncbi:chromosome segregation protein SMC [Fusobacterium sp. PH5-44]|uniref:chromosome segregation protein SMC n=1 Tax=unclassified Fusobacterium TaxID=2648384 RepID=UPI003D23CA70